MEHADDRCVVMLRDVLDQLKSTNRYENVFHLAVDHIERLFKCQTCAIVLIDQRTEYLHVENSIGLSLTFRKAFRRRMSTGLIGELLWTGQPVVLRDSSTNPALARELKLEHPFTSCACFQIAVEHRTLGYLHVDTAHRHDFTDHDLILLQMFADLAGLACHKANLVEENLRLDVIDHETGLEKYAPFIERLHESMERSRNVNEPFAVILGDIDNFKDISHTYGYECSRQLLKEVGMLLRSHIRPADSVGRYGSDEFIILRVNASVADTIEFANAIRQKVEESTFTRQIIRSTVSMAVAGFPENGSSVEDLILTAKKALFEAQRAGRNNVYHYPSVWYKSDAPLNDTRS